MANPGEITLVPLGPLTNVALAVATEPRIAENVREVVLMGGAANVAGNASPVAEANIRNDPESAHIVFHAGWPLTMVGLDVTEKTVMTPEYLEELGQRQQPLDRFHRQDHPALPGISHSAGAMNGIPVHDSSAHCLRHRSDPVRDQASLRRRRLPQPIPRREHRPRLARAARDGAKRQCLRRCR